MRKRINEINTSSPTSLRENDDVNSEAVKNIIKKTETEFKKIKDFVELGNQL